MRLEGKNFEEGANILFDGAPLASPRVARRGRLIFAEVAAALVATPGTHSIQVANPGGTTSEALTLTVVEKAPEVTIRLRGVASEEDPGTGLITSFRGDGLRDNFKVFVWHRSVVAERVSDDEIRFVIPESFLNEPASVPVTLRNNNGGFSNTVVFTIVPKPAILDSLNPDSIEVGNEDFLLRAFGEFKDSAVIVVNGQPLETRLRESGRLEATIPAALRAAPGQLIVRIEQDGVQSQDLVIRVTPTVGPFIFTVAPTRLRQGESRTTIEIVGANFDNQTEVLIDGQEARVRDGSTRRRLLVVVTSDLLATPGTHTVQVRDRDGNLAAPVMFEVVPDVAVSTLAGDNRDGFNDASACVSADDALFRRPRRIAVGADGLLYITDQQNHAIRTVDPDTGQVCTIAGTGLDGYHDSGNPAGEPPTFSFPNGIAVAANGTILVTENGNSVVRSIARSGNGVTVDTFAGSFDTINDPDRQRRINSTRRGLDGFDNGPLLDSSFRQPDEIIIASDGTIYLADALNNSIRRIRNGIVDTVAGNGVPGFADGDAAKARFNTPTSIALSLDENFLFVADTNNHRIRIINLSSGIVETYAGNGARAVVDGPPGEASFDQPIGLAVDTDGRVYVSEVGGNVIRSIDTSGNVSTLAGGGSSKFRDGPGVEAKFDNPRGIAIDRQRRILYVADYENFRIRSIQLP
jgi:sugar lactone lactonase YvrE